MDEVRQFCGRVLGDAGCADAAVAGLTRRESDDRLGALQEAVQRCRRRAPVPGPGASANADEPADLASAVARELAAATARMSVAQREALALSGVVGLSHEELATVIGQTPSSVALLLADARLALRDELRGAAPPPAPCPERERALRTIALRQDREPVPEPDEAWLIEHLGHCSGCARAHSAMLEAAACYRAWRPGSTAAVETNTAS